VLVLDEWHGIQSQIFSSRNSSAIWEKLAALIMTVNRVIVLDADLNDNDVKLFHDLGRTEIKMICNGYLIDAGKKFYVELSHKENLNNLLDALKQRYRVVIFSHNKRHGNYSVESLARLLQQLGYRVKYYHADTNSDERRRDFSDPVATFDNTDVVIYNHTLEAGVSIIDERFQRLFIFSEEIGSLEATKQALHRFRNINEIHYSAAKCSRCAELPLIRESIIEAVKSRERDSSTTELLFRALNFNELHSS
jgi:hypothetical protein